MPGTDKEELSRNEQAMLDLALRCDLDLAPETERPAIRARHGLIKTHADALVYIRALEAKVFATKSGASAGNAQSPCLA